MKGWVRPGPDEPQAAPPAKVPAPAGAETLTSARLTQLLAGLNDANYQVRLLPELENLTRLDLKKQAEANALINNWAKTHKLDENQRKFLYELAAATAPAAAALQADKDYLLTADGFRKQNGPYREKSNNCRHYGFKLYYQGLGPLLEPGLSKTLGKKIYGRPSGFDWQSSGIKRYPARDWDRMSQDQKDAKLAGRPTFVYYTYDSKDLDAILKTLKPGDLIGVDRNPRTQNAHVGIYVGDGQIIHIGRPLYRDDLKDFVRRAHTVTVYKLVRRNMEKPDLSMLMSGEPVGD
ncbi:Lecithin retinol acyltransferase [uncultured archaeon]|nr:Lecithin retinol acyltransferase [uncultured archaeon]